MRRIALAALVATLGAAAPAVLDDPPGGLIPSSTTLTKVRALYARDHPRERLRPATIIEEWRLTQDHLTGTYRVYKQGRDERDVTALGPFNYEQGVRGGLHWQQTRNGQTFTFSGVHAARAAVTDRAFYADAGDHARLIGESVPLNAYVVELDPPGGRHEWRFIDKRSGNLVRREYVERRRRYAVSYDDYRVFDGVGEPSRVRTVDGYGNERDLVLHSRTLDLTPDAKDVEITPPRRTLVEFPAGTPTVRLPVRFVNGLLVVHVAIGLREYDFLLDSGSAGIVVDPSVVEEAHAQRYGSRIGMTVGTFSESSSIIPQMTVGGLRMRSVVVRVLNVPFRADEHTRISGLLGFDFFDDTVIHVDGEHAVVDAAISSGFHPPAESQPIPLALDDRTAVARVRVGNAFGRVVLDTGANRSVFTTAFAERGDFVGDSSGTTSRFRGIGGTGTAEAVHAKLFDLGGIALADPVVDVSGADLGGDEIDGTAGMDLLRSFDLVFDYRAAMLYVRRVRRPSISRAG